MHLLFDHFDQLAQAPENLRNLRQWIIDLGVRGQLTQAWRKEHPTTEPASALLEKIRAEKAKLVKEKKIKKGKPLPPIAADEVPFKLPSPWTWCRLGEVIEYADNLNIHSELQPNQVVHYVDIDAVDNTSYRIKEPKVQIVSELSSRARRVLKPGYLVYSMVRPYLNNIALIEEEHEYFIGSTGFSVFKGIQVSNLYIFNVLLSSHIRSVFLNYLSGFNSPSINQEQFQQTLIPLPPLAEQQAIVKKVESLLAKVSQLQERAGEVGASKMKVGQAVCGWLADAPLGGETARRFRSVAPQFNEVFSTLPNLKALRQTILQLAIQGKLTEAWRAAYPTAEPASALLKRIQTEKARLVKEKKIKKPKPLLPITEDEVPLDLPEGWVWCRLGEVSNFIDYRGKTPRKVNKGVKLITAKNVKVGHFSSDPEEFITESDYQKHMTRGIPINGDILFTTEAPMGNACLLDQIDIFALAQKIITIQPIELSSEFLLLVILSSAFKEQLMKKASGVTARGIKSSRLVEILVPIPPLAEQQAIVEKVETLLVKVSQLEQEVEQNRQHAEQLLQSVLREVMQGIHPAKEITS